MKPLPVFFQNQNNFLYAKFTGFYNDIRVRKIEKPYFPGGCDGILCNG